MLNVFETPWLLFSVSLVSLIVVWVIRQSLPEKKTGWLLLVPLTTAILAGVLEYYVQTDYEKIDGLLERGRRAAVHNDPAGLAATLAAHYSDRVHDSREEMVNWFTSFFETSQIDGLRRTASQVVATSPTATAECTYRVRLAPNSAYSQAATLYFVKVRFRLSKQPDGKWLISGADLLEVNFQPMNWGDV